MPAGSVFVGGIWKRSRRFGHPRHDPSDNLRAEKNVKTLIHSLWSQIDMLPIKELKIKSLNTLADYVEGITDCHFTKEA